WRPRGRRTRKRPKPSPPKAILIKARAIRAGRPAANRAGRAMERCYLQRRSKVRAFVACPLTLSLSPMGRGDAAVLFFPSPLGERKGPIAKRWEGEGASDGRTPL